jgi:hypothetical protein
VEFVRRVSKVLRVAMIKRQKAKKARREATVGMAWLVL